MRKGLLFSLIFTCGLLTACSAIFAVRFSLASQNVHMELPFLSFDLVLIEECQVPHLEATARLFQGPSSSMTTSDSYHVMLRKQDEPFSRQVFYAYSSPVIAGIECDDAGLTLQSPFKEPIHLPTEDLQHVYLSEALRYYKGNLLSDAERREQLRITAYQSAASTVIFAIAGAFLLYRSSRAE
jgi:hypothetical protein